MYEAKKEKVFIPCLFWEADCLRKQNLNLTGIYKEIIKMSRTLRNAQQRIDALLRVISILCIILGGVFAYFISTTTLIPQLVPIFYFMAGLMIFVGAAVLIARYE